MSLYCTFKLTDSSNNKRNALILNRLITVFISEVHRSRCIIRLLLKLLHSLKQSNPYMWTGVSRSSLARLSSRRLWRRSCWFSWDSILPLALDFVFVFLAWRLSSDFSGVSSLLLTSSMKMKRLVSPARRRFSRCLQSCSLRSLVFCITVKSCLFFSAVSKHGVLACTREFLCFLVHFIHNGTFS